MSDFMTLLNEQAATKTINAAKTDAELAAEIRKEAERLILVSKNAFAARVRKACRRQWPKTQMLGDKLAAAVQTMYDCGVLEEMARCIGQTFGEVKPGLAASKLFPQAPENAASKLLTRKGLIGWLEQFGTYDLDTDTAKPITHSSIGTVDTPDFVAIYLGQKNEPTTTETAAALREFATDDWTENATETTDRISSEHADTTPDDETTPEVMDVETVAQMIDELIDNAEQAYHDAAGIEEVEAAAEKAAQLPQTVADACRKHRKSLRTETVNQLKDKAAHVAHFVRHAAAL